MAQERDSDERKGQREVLAMISSTKASSDLLMS
jgi:hypothetical protein